MWIDTCTLSCVQCVYRVCVCVLGCACRWSVCVLCVVCCVYMYQYLITPIICIGIGIGICIGICICISICICVCVCVAGAFTQERPGQGPWFPRELKACLIRVIRVSRVSRVIRVTYLVPRITSKRELMNSFITSKREFMKLEKFISANLFACTFWASLVNRCLFQSFKYISINCCVQTCMSYVMHEKKKFVFVHPRSHSA